MKITDVRFVRVTGSWDYAGPLGEERLVRPVDIYPEFKEEGAGWFGPDAEPPYPVSQVFVLIDTDEGVTGMYGPTQDEVARIIQRQFARILIGENPHAVERIWDKMYRGAIHGRKGPTMMAISHLDLALWDLKGKLLGAPAHELLGGPSRDKIRTYASMLGYSIEPELAAARLKEIVAEGYTATKWFFRHAPSDGEEGVRKNVELVGAVREAVGPDVEIMFDAWNSWDVPYTVRMAELIRPYRVWWIEEPVMPDMIPQYAEIRRSVSGVCISGGEHEYTRWGIKGLLDAGAVDILQPDPTWAGGLTELTKIAALASSYGIPVVPHHGGLASTQFIASQTLTTCPMQEWLIQYGERFQVFLTHKIEPRDGYIDVPTDPGLPMEFDDDAVETREDVTF